MGRHAKPDVGTANELATVEALKEATQPMTDAVARESAIAEGTQFGVIVGRMQAFRLVHGLSERGLLSAFREIRDGELWRHGPVTIEGGKRVWCKSIREACELALGVSYSKLVEIDQNERELGAELFESAQRIGLRRDDMRALRALPAPKREKIAEEIQAGANSKQVLAILNDISDELDAARKRADVEKEKADALAEKLDQVKADLAAAKKRRAALTEEQAAALAVTDEHAEHAGSINSAVQKMDALWDQASETGMVRHYETYNRLRRDVALAKMALDALVERHGIDLTLDEPPADIFAPAQQPGANVVQ